MHKEILRVLLDKPEIYLRAWSWIYSRSDDSGITRFSYEDLDLMGRVKVSDPTFKRILSTHLEWNKYRRYTKIEQVKSETGITYIVTFYEKPLEMTEEEKKTVLAKLEKLDRTVDKPKRKLTAEQILLRKKCLELYIFFYETRISIKPPINAMQMKALDTMIKYFQNTGKANTDESIILAFEMIYKFWDTYPEGIRTKFLLSQISYSLPNILAHIRLAHKQSKLNKVQEFGKNIGEAIESGSLDKQIENLGKR